MADGNEPVPVVFEPPSSSPTIVGGDQGIAIPALPKIFEFGVNLDFSEEAAAGRGVEDELVALGRAPEATLQLIKQVRKDAEAIVADGDLSDQGRGKKLAELIEPALARLKKLEDQVPALVALREQAVQIVAKEIAGSADAATLQRRGMLQRALLDLDQKTRSERVLRMIAETDVEGLRAVVDLPLWTLGIAENTMAMARERLATATTKGSAAAARADKVRRAIENGELAIRTSRQFLGQIIAQREVVRDALVASGSVEKPSHEYSLEERADFISKNGLDAWIALVRRSHG